MILNTGNRTDIPAFFSEWFMQRIKAGYVYTRNPYNPQMIILCLNIWMILKFIVCFGILL